MSVEMRVVLVGEDDDSVQQQQRAIDQPSTAPAQAGQPAETASSEPIAASASLGTDKPLESVFELTEAIDELIAAVNNLADKTEDSAKHSAGPGKPPKPPPIQTPERGGVEGFLAKLDDQIQGRLQYFGLNNSRAGRMVAMGSRAARRLGTSAARAAGSMFGRFAGGAAAKGAATAAASGTATGAAGGAAAAAGGAAVMAPIAAVAAPLVAIGLAAAGAALTLKLFMNAVEKAANSLEDLSPDIAAGRAQANVRMEMRRLERAQAIGPGLANLEAAKFRLDESMYEVQTKMYELLLKFSPVVETMLDGINVGVRGINLTSETLQYIWSKINDLPLLGQNLQDNNQALIDFVQAHNKFTRALNQFLDLGINGAPAPGQVDPFVNDFFNMRGRP
jgi:hypothetical protein